MLKEKKEWVDISKGIGIVLVVMNHAINGITNCVDSKYALWYELIYNLISTFEMPLFFIISGYLYSYTTKINSSNDYFIFIKKKLIALGIPYIIFNVIYGVFGSIIHENKYSINNLKYILVRPISHFWYVYILLLLFIIIPALELILSKNKKNQVILIIFTICSFIILYALQAKIVYPLNLLFKYLPFFVLGILLCKISFIPKKVNNKMLIGGFILYVITTYISNVFFKYKEVIFIGAFIMGSIASLLIIIFTDKLLHDKKVFIEKIGRGSFEIYLIHSLFVSFVRTILLKMNITNMGINVVCETIAGVLIPYILYYLSNKSILLKICFRPYSIYKTIIKSPPKNVF